MPSYEIIDPGGVSLDPYPVSTILRSSYIGIRQLIARLLARLLRRDFNNR
jgi:hypothetical protein